ncbi:type II restriction endonuclease [Empedobacter falsenii]|uniref:hypothetical protein n=1 Tax=Empedobacter falsenii TaxID=343874 RepID=UPI002575F196|nr:hypothetical protein [Empedobacter falsenii]MDM1299790.1 type II restriction endonuclease [Empedobacter falsenii]MDM1319583.1 type II restriction endonuclease [Empedobacter falsenii]
MNQKQLKGSQTAKNGFANEDDIINKFNEWKSDEDSQKWLIIMGYSLDEIENVIAVKVPSGNKSDIQAQISIYLKNVIDAQNIQVKLVSNKRGFNQIDRRWVDKCIEQWDMPEDIATILKYFTGELPPYKESRNRKRMFMDEFSLPQQQSVINWLENNKTIIVSDILKGRGQFSSEWLLVAQKLDKNSKWILKPINYCLNFYGNEAVSITSRGSLNIGKIGLQRKGGDGGRMSANQLQFKIDPTLLFDE